MYCDLNLIRVRLPQFKFVVICFTVYNVPSFVYKSSVCGELELFRIKTPSLSYIGLSED